MHANLCKQRGILYLRVCAFPGPPQKPATGRLMATGANFLTHSPQLSGFSYLGRDGREKEWERGNGERALDGEKKNSLPPATPKLTLN